MAAGPFGEAAEYESPLRKYSVTIAGMSGSLAGAPSRPSTKPEGRTTRTVGWGPRGGSIPRIGARSNGHQDRQDHQPVSPVAEQFGQVPCDELLLLQTNHMSKGRQNHHDPCEVQGEQG